MKEWYQKRIDEIEQELGTKEENGLSSEVAAEKQVQVGLVVEVWIILFI